MEEFAACWEELDDPRTGNAALHDFIELLVIALCSVLSGGQGAVDMGLYVRAKEPFLRGFLKLANGLPTSHDTNRDNTLALPGKLRHEALKRYLELLRIQPAKQPAEGEQRLVLAQIATDSNEITAVPRLLGMLSLKGAIVTTDALNCQRVIAQQIVD